MFEFDVGLLCLCNLWSGDGRDLLFLATICKLFAWVALLCYITWVVLVVTVPEFFEKAFHFTMVSLFAGIPKVE
jgi:hypothetical protein